MTLLKVILNNFLIKLKNFINDFLNDTLQVTSPLQLKKYILWAVT